MMFYSRIIKIRQAPPLMMFWPHWLFLEASNTAVSSTSDEIICTPISKYLIIICIFINISQNNGISNTEGDIQNWWSVLISWNLLKVDFIRDFICDRNELEYISFNVWLPILDNQPLNLVAILQIQSRNWILLLSKARSKERYIWLKTYNIV
jgi:hypothetical protein